MTILSESSDVHVNIKGFKIFKDRHGKLRCYHRASGEKIDLDKFPVDGLDFLGECGRIAALYKPSSEAKPGSLGLLVVEYKKSPAWQILEPKSREWYEMAFEYLKPINDTPLFRFNPPLVVKIMDRAIQVGKSWYFANQIKTSLSTIFSWAVERGMMDANPAKQVKKKKRPKDKPRANRPWTDNERFTALQEAPAHFKANLGIMMYIGLDPCDTIALRKNQSDGNAVDTNRKKTGHPVWKPIPTALKVILAAAPAHNAVTICANSYGEPWTKSGQDSVWFKLKADLLNRGLIGEGLTLKGLRHSHATLLGEQGENDRTIADALGDESESMGRHYSRDASVKKKMEKVVVAFNKNESKKLKNFVKPSGKSVKP